MQRAVGSPDVDGEGGGSGRGMRCRTRTRAGAPDVGPTSEAGSMLIFGALLKSGAQSEPRWRSILGPTSYKIRSGLGSERALEML
jgi:hypothetical protein